MGQGVVQRTEKNKCGWRRKSWRQCKRGGQKSRKRTDSVQTSWTGKGVWILLHMQGEVIWGFKHGSEIMWFAFSTSVLKSTIEWQSIFKTGALRERGWCQEAAEFSPEWGSKHQFREYVHVTQINPRAHMAQAIHSFMFLLIQQIFIANSVLNARHTAV